MSVSAFSQTRYTDNPSAPTVAGVLLSDGSVVMIDGYTPTTTNAIATYSFVTNWVATHGGGGGGSGDFMANGSVPMTGNFNAGGNVITNASDIVGVTSWDANNGSIATFAVGGGLSPLDPTTYVNRMGDAWAGAMNADGNGLYGLGALHAGASADDGTGALIQSAMDISAAYYYWAGGQQGQTGSFKDGDGNAVTVTGGIITSFTQWP